MSSENHEEIGYMHDLDLLLTLQLLQFSHSWRSGC